MKIICVDDLVKNIVKRWKDSYCINGGWAYESSTHPKELIYKKLLRLGRNKTKEKVDEIIGNSSWTSLICDECGSYVNAVIELGEVFADTYLSNLNKTLD